MEERNQIPVFPLALLPFPGELVPLHIFEPRYRQLLLDAETSDIQFGIYCNHDLNKDKIGSVMKLESIIKRYPTGESDIVVRCKDIFTVEKMFRSHKSKMYGGAEVQLWNVDGNEMPGSQLYEDFIEYQQKRNISNHFNIFNLYQIALELNLDLYDRYKFLNYTSERKLTFLSTQLKFQLHVLSQEERSKDFFHLN